MKWTLFTLALAGLALMSGCDMTGSGSTGGSGTMTASGTAAVVLEAEAMADQKDTKTADNKEASGGKVVVFENFTSEASGTVALAAGTWEVVVTGSAPNDSQDALNLSLEPTDEKSGVKGSRQRIFWSDKYNALIAQEQAVMLVVPANTTVKVTLAVDDETGMSVDKLTFKPVK